MTSGPPLTADQRVRAARPPAIPGPASIPLGESPMLTRLRAAHPEAAAFEHAVWQQAQSGTPIVERDADPAVRLLTFLWRDAAAGRGAPRGRGAAASRVVLFANKRFDRGDPDRTALRRLPGTDVWTLTLRVPADWQASYQILVDRTPDGSADLRALVAGASSDPLNPCELPQGPVTKSVIDLPGTFAVDPAARVGAQAPVEHVLDIGGEPRSVWTFAALPEPGAGRSAAVPERVAHSAAVSECVVLDGRMWIEQLDLPARIAAAQAAGVLPPMRFVLVDSGPEARRIQELTCVPETADLLADRLGSFADQAFGGRPAARWVAGSSLSGLQAVFTALARPDVFAGALAQSGSFWWPSAELPAGWLAANVPAGAQRFCLQDGTDEWVNTEPTAQLLRALRGAGHRVVDRTVAGGHDRVWWAARFADGLADCELARSSDNG